MSEEKPTPEGITDSQEAESVLRAKINLNFRQVEDYLNLTFCYKIMR